MVKRLVVALACWFIGCDTSGVAQNFVADSARLLPELATGYYIETFTAWSEGDPLDGHQKEWESPGSNGWSWMASAPGPGNNALYSLYRAVSTSAYQDSLSFQFSGTATYVFAGEFWGTQFDGFPQTTELEIRTDTGLRLSQVVSDPTFIGIVSSEPLSTVTIRTSAGQPAWATARQIITGDLRPDGDFDGDGMSNGDERIAGTDATNCNSKFAVVGMEPSATGSTELIVRFTAVAGRSYQLEYKDSLGEPAWSPAEGEPQTPAQSGTAEFRDSPSATRRFYRVAIAANQ